MLEPLGRIHKVHDPFTVELYTFVQLCEVEIKLKLRIYYTHSKDMSQCNVRARRYVHEDSDYTTIH